MHTIKEPFKAMIDSKYFQAYTTVKYNHTEDEYYATITDNKGGHISITFTQEDIHIMHPLNENNCRIITLKQ